MNICNIRYRQFNNFISGIIYETFTANNFRAYFKEYTCQLYFLSINDYLHITFSHFQPTFFFHVSFLFVPIGMKLVQLFKEITVYSKCIKMIIINSDNIVFGTSYRPPQKCETFHQTIFYSQVIIRKNVFRYWREFECFIQYLLQSVPCGLIRK